MSQEPEEFVGLVPCHPDSSGSSWFRCPRGTVGCPIMHGGVDPVCIACTDGPSCDRHDGLRRRFDRRMTDAGASPEDIAAMHRASKAATAYLAATEGDLPLDGGPVTSLDAEEQA